MSETRTYPMNGSADLESIAQNTEKFLKMKNLRTQLIPSDTHVVIQAYGDTSEWKKFLGMDAALTVEMNVKNDVLSVKVGNAKWYDKAGVAAVGMIAFSPLILTAAYGTLKQAFLPDEVFGCIEEQLLGRGRGFTSDTCPDCGAKTHVGDLFCPKCGHKLA